MTLLQPSHPLCWWGLPAAFVSPGGQRCPKGLNLPRQKSACKVMEELLLSQQYQPLTCKQAHGDRGRGTGGGQTINLDATIPADLPEDAADVVILDDEVLSFPGDYPETFLLLKLKWLQATSDHQRT